MQIHQLNKFSGQIIDCAITVHRALGCGLMESVYEACLAYELSKRGLKVDRQKAFPVKYDGISFDLAFRADLIVEDCILVELKAVERVLPVHEAQTLTYMRLLNLSLGLLMNFHALRLKDGLKRFRI
jgi:GxxExxY protein